MPANATLSLWHWDCTTDAINFDSQDVYITDSNGDILQAIFHQSGNCQSWVNHTVDLTSYVGQTIRIKFLVTSGWLWGPNRHGLWTICS